MTLHWRSILLVTKGPMALMPALWIKISMGGRVANRSKMLFIFGSAVKSATKKRMRPPALIKSAWVWVARSTSTSMPVTVAPLFVNCCASARPMPSAAPVMTQWMGLSFDKVTG